jgi:hypothetical protein
MMMSTSRISINGTIFGVAIELPALPKSIPIASSPVEPDDLILPRSGARRVGAGARPNQLNKRMVRTADAL